MSKILMGSRYFFSEYPDFESKDIDEIELVETEQFKHMRQITGSTRCLFQLKKYSSYEEYLDWDIKYNLGMAAGKYLIPEFCAEIEFPFSVF